MGWRTEWWEAKRRRSNAQHGVSVLHDAAQAHFTRFLSAHSVALLSIGWRWRSIPKERSPSASRLLA
jgi:hypothetical protein